MEQLTVIYSNGKLSHLSSPFVDITSIVSRCASDILAVIMAPMKDNTLADKLRSEGNEFYKNGQYFEAMKKFNESLCCATMNSTSMGFAFANRSVIYFLMKEFRKCISNIQRAKEHGYPEIKLPVLDERLEKATRLKEVEVPADPENNPFDYFKLSYPAHQKNCSIVECLELAVNNKYGRQLITNKDLKAGDVIAIEQAAMKVFLTNQTRFQFCAYCLKSNKMDLMPCKKCITSKS